MNINITPILFLPSNTEFFDTIHNYLFYLLLSLIISFLSTMLLNVAEGKKSKRKLKNRKQSQKFQL